MLGVRKSPRSLRIPLSLFGLALLALCACESRQPRADPSLTQVNAPAVESPYWVPITEEFGPGAEGLQRRDSTFAEAALATLDRSADGTGPAPDVTIFFDYDTSYLRPDQRPALTEVYEYLDRSPSTNLLIEGHADWRGTADYNLALGDRRARAVLQFLNRLGIDEARLEIVSRGDLEAALEADETRMARDRRAELYYIP